MIEIITDEFSNGVDGEDPINMYGADGVALWEAVPSWGRHQGTEYGAQ